MSPDMMLQQRCQRISAQAASQAAFAPFVCRNARAPSCSSRASPASAAVQAPILSRCTTVSRRALRPIAVLPAAPAPPTPSSYPNAVGSGKLISSTEVPPFIQRDDMVDQLYHWSIIEAGDGGFRNFGMPMNVEPVYKDEVLWGFVVGMFKDGAKLADIGVGFDNGVTQKHEWLGRGEDGFPINEGRTDTVQGKNIEIWKLDPAPVTEELRSAIRAYCTGLVSAINRYYAFGSVFVDDERG